MEFIRLTGVTKTYKTGVTAIRDLDLSNSPFFIKSRCLYF